MGFNSGFKRLNKETSQKKCTFMYIHRFGKAKLDDWPASLFTENGGWQHLGNSTPRDGFIYTLASTKYGIEIVTLRDGVLIYVQTENRKEFKDYEKKKVIFHGATVCIGPGPPHYQGFTILLMHTTLDMTNLFFFISNLIHCFSVYVQYLLSSSLYMFQASQAHHQEV